MGGNAEFTKKMKKTHTILLPNMLPYHNQLLQAAFLASGYHLEILSGEKNLTEYSLPYISGDYCLPAVLILGQMLSAVQSGNFDLNKIAFMEPQTGGACRAGNYYNSIIESMKKAGCPQIPVISLNALGREKQEGFIITRKLLFGAVAAVCYGDLLMTLYQQVRPYEIHRGQAKECLDKWQLMLSEDIAAGKNISRRKRRKIYSRITEDFAAIPREEKTCSRVGIAGEVYIKFSPVGNEHLEEFLQKRGCDYRMGGFVNYAIYIVDSERTNQKIRGAGAAVLRAYSAVIQYLTGIQKDIHETLSGSGIFEPDADFDRLKEMAKQVIDENCNTGDGWLIAGEVADLVEKGYENILIVHPFGCLVSHICERGIMKKLHARFPGINIQTVEYDYDSSRTLRESRILLGISNIARK